MARHLKKMTDVHFTLSHLELTTNTKMGSVIGASYYNTGKQSDFKTICILWTEVTKQPLEKLRYIYISYSILVWESHLGFVWKERLSLWTIRAKSKSPHSKRKVWLEESKRGCID